MYESRPIFRTMMKMCVAFLAVFVCCPLPIFLTGAHITASVMRSVVAQCNQKLNMDHVLACLSTVTSQAPSLQIRATLSLFAIVLLAISLIGIVFLSYHPILRGSRKVNWGLE